MRHRLLVVLSMLYVICYILTGLMLLNAKIYVFIFIGIDVLAYITLNKTTFSGIEELIKKEL